MKYGFYQKIIPYRNYVSADFLCKFQQHLLNNFLRKRNTIPKNMEKIKMNIFFIFMFILTSTIAYVHMSFFKKMECTEGLHQSQIRGIRHNMKLKPAPRIPFGNLTVVDLISFFTWPEHILQT